MNSTQVLQQAARRAPLIKFLGKRSTPSTFAFLSDRMKPPRAPHNDILTSLPESVDHTPAPHPASPDSSLPESFAQYRAKAQQHGPLSGNKVTQRVDSHSYGGIGGATGQSLGPVKPPAGMFFDRTELPERFKRLAWTEGEIEAVGSGGASMFG